MSVNDIDIIWIIHGKAWRIKRLRQVDLKKIRNVRLYNQACMASTQASKHANNTGKQAGKQGGKQTCKK